jgi:outer membrane protein W
MLNGRLGADEWPRTGIGIRFSHWNVKDATRLVHVYHDDWGSDRVNAGGYGGSLFFFSKLTSQLFMEFTVGAIGTVEQRNHYWDYEEVKADAVLPFLFGLRYNLLPQNIHSVLQPYAQAGFGTYWINDVFVENGYYDDDYEDVIVNSQVRPGGYIGAGLNFMLSKKFAINYDMRYHFVDFNNKEYHNGIEFGFGGSFMWGN